MCQQDTAWRHYTLDICLDGHRARVSPLFDQYIFLCLCFWLIWERNWRCNPLSAQQCSCCLIFLYLENIVDKLWAKVDISKQVISHLTVQYVCRFNNNNISPISAANSIAALCTVYISHYQKGKMFLLELDCWQMISFEIDNRAQAGCWGGWQPLPAWADYTQRIEEMFFPVNQKLDYLPSWQHCMSMSLRIYKCHKLWSCCKNLRRS